MAVLRRQNVKKKEIIQLMYNFYALFLLIPPINMITSICKTNHMDDGFKRRMFIQNQQFAVFSQLRTPREVQTPIR